MKKYFFLFLAVLLLITAFRQVIFVSEPLTAYQFFTIISDLNMTPDHQIDLILQLRDEFSDILQIVGEVRIPGSDDWQHGDRDIFSLVKMIAEIALDLGTIALTLVSFVPRILRILCLSFLEALEYVYEFLKLVLRLLGIWRLPST